jgi:hypothetical protein
MALSSAHVILKRVLRPHTDLAIELLRMVRCHDTSDPSYRFQIAGVIVFLAGVDKTLGLALQLLYLAGKVEWKWLKPRRPRPGILACGPGLTPKLEKLESLGFNVTALGWLVALRNSYVHGCQVQAGYRVRAAWGRHPRLHLRAAGPSVSWADEPLVGVGEADLRAWSRHLTGRLGRFVDRQGWKSGWTNVSRKLRRLPRNPEPEADQLQTFDPLAIGQMLDSLNRRYVGEGFRLLFD